MAAEIPPNESVQQASPPQTQTRTDNGPMWFGLILILIGGYFLMTTLGIVDNFRLPFDNWWALFFLIPIVASARSAWQAYKAAGDQFTSQVVGPLVGTMIFATLLTVFIFDLDWGKIWPVFVIFLGIIVLGQSMLRRDGN